MPHRAAVRESDVKPLRLLFTAALLAAAAGAAFWYYGRPEAVSVIGPERGSAAEIVFASGVVEPRNWAKVTSLVRERIVEVCNCEGARVAKGDVLARLDASEAEATLTELRARQKLAVDERDRLTLLVERNVTSVTALERARAEVSQVEALIAGQTARLENYELRAPGDGLILRQDAEVGEIAEPGNVLFWVGRPHPRIVIAEVNEEDIPRVEAGQRVLIRSDAFPRSELEATVDSITPKGDPVTRTYRVRLALPQDTPLMIGMSVDANIVTRVVEDALLVPALVLDGDTLFIVEDDVARRQTVETGIRGTERIEILSGIDASAQIISPTPKGSKTAPASPSRAADMRLILDIAVTHILGRGRQTLVAVIGVAVGVGFSIAMAALMQGGQDDFVEQLIDTMPHVQITDEQRSTRRQPAETEFDAAAISGIRPPDDRRGIINPTAAMAWLGGWVPGNLAQSLRTQGVVRYQGREAGAAFVGVEPEMERAISPIVEDFTAGSFAALSQGGNNLVVGDRMAEKLGAGLGDTVTAVSSSGLSRNFRITGLFHTGTTARDEGEATCS